MVKKYLCWLFWGIFGSIWGQKPMLMAQQKDQWHVVNNQGKTMNLNGFVPTEPISTCFQKGFYRVKRSGLTENRECLLDQSGRVVFESPFDFEIQILTPPDEFGLFSVRRPHEGKRFVCDLNGQIRSPEMPILHYLGKGVATYPTPDEGKKQYFILFDVINQKIIRKVEAASIEDMSEDRIPFYLETDDDELVGFLDLEGREIIPPRYEPGDDDHFEDGITHLERNEKTYVFNRSGMILYEGNEFLDVAGHGFFTVEGDAGVFLYNNSGAIVNTFGLMSCSDVSQNGLFFFVDGQLSGGLMNVNGNVLVRGTQYERGTVSDTHGFLFNKNNGSMEVFDANGDLVSGFNANWIGNPKFGKLLFQTKSGEQGVVSSDGKILLAAQSSKLITFYDGFFIVREGNLKFRAFNDNGQVILEDLLVKSPTELIYFLQTKNVFVDY